VLNLHGFLILNITFVAIDKAWIVSTLTLRNISAPFWRQTAMIILIIGGLNMLFERGQVYAQDRLELGGFIGTSYYFGDLNPGKQFYKPHPASGGLARYVFTDRIAFKASATYGRISGEYPGNNLLYKENADYASKYSFGRSIGDIAAQVEINFLSYDHPFISTTNFTPYISMGLATTLYNRIDTEDQNAAAKPVFILSLPFGVGVKYKINKWIRVGAEWTFRKTFVDDLDYVGPGAINPADPYEFEESRLTHNNDWYSFAGVFVTFNLLKRKTECKGGY